MLLHKDRLCTFWNHAFRCHTSYCKDCKGDLHLNDQLCRKWGLSWELAVTCTRCQFSSDRMKIFNEVNTGLRGRKSTTVNMGIQVGLLKQEISNTCIRQVLAATNVIPPSASAMQKSANRVNEIISFTNEHDMANTCNELQHLNMLLERSPDHPIPAEADATYNNKIYRRVRITPFQAGTQVTMLMAENLTPKEKTIATKTYSKHCSCRRPTADSPHSTSVQQTYPEMPVSGMRGQSMLLAYRLAIWHWMERAHQGQQFKIFNKQGLLKSSHNIAHGTWATSCRNISKRQFLHQNIPRVN